MKFAILIYPGVEPIDLGATAGVLSMARRFEPGIEIITLAQYAGEVVMASGVRALADYGYADCPAFDILIVTGGPGWKEQCANAATLDFIRRAKAHSTIASVCTGGLILAAAGLAEGKPITTRRLSAPGEKNPLRILSEMAPSADAKPALIVDTGGVISGGGVTLAIDVMFHLLGKCYGNAVRKNTAKLMEYDRALAANSRFLETIHADGMAAESEK